MGIGSERARRIFLHEGAKTSGGFLVLAGLELIQGSFVFLTFLGRITGRFGICPVFRVDRSTGAFGSFKLAQAGVEVEVEVLLALLGRLQLVIERFDLAAQPGNLIGLALDLVGQIQLALGLLVESRLALDAQIDDLPASFVVVKNASVGLNRTQRGNQKGDSNRAHV